jgi:two-component system chemotaxis response regulator CheB
VQEPADAYFPDMPRNALRIAGADYVLPLRQIGPTLVHLTRQAAAARGVPPMSDDPMDNITEKIEQDKAAQANGQRNGTTSVYSCPECGGVLWQVQEEKPLRFRCHVGHSYYGEDLLVEKSEALEAGLWVAVRTFREKATLSRQLAVREREKGNTRAAERFQEQADTADKYGTLIQQHILEGASGRIFDHDAGRHDPGGSQAADQPTNKENN